MASDVILLTVTVDGDSCGSDSCEPCSFRDGQSLGLDNHGSEYIRTDRKIREKSPSGLIQRDKHGPIDPFRFKYGSEMGQRGQASGPPTRLCAPFGVLPWPT
jgi:hypothetical protein